MRGSPSGGVPVTPESANTECQPPPWVWHSLAPGAFRGRALGRNVAKVTKTAQVCLRRMSIEMAFLGAGRARGRAAGCGRRVSARRTVPSELPRHFVARHPDVNPAPPNGAPGVQNREYVVGEAGQLDPRPLREHLPVREDYVHRFSQIEERSQEMPIGVKKEQTPSEPRASWFHPRFRSSLHLCQSV